METPCQLPNSEDDGERLALLEAEVISCLPAFGVLRAQLGDTAKQVEQAVVEVCQSFQGIVERARESVSQAAATVAGTGTKPGSEAGLSQTVLAAAEKMMERSEAATQNCLRAVEKMAKLEEEMSRIEDSLVDIDDIAKAVRLLGFNATIEAARAGAHGLAFGVVADETTKLAGKAAHINRSIQRTVQQLCKDTSNASQELRSMSTRFSNDCRASRTELNKAVAAMTSGEEQLRHAVEHSARVSKSLADDVSHAVIALQFQDRVNQQVTHVVDTLQGMEAGLAGRLQGKRDGIAAKGEPKQRDWAERLANFYTMQSERDVHAIRVKSEGTGRGSSVPAFGDNVEFF